MDSEFILNYITAIAPSITAVVTIIISVVKIIASVRGKTDEIDKKISDLKAEMERQSSRLNNENDQLAATLKDVLTENAALKREIRLEREARTGVKEA